MKRAETGMTNALPISRFGTKPNADIVLFRTDLKSIVHPNAIHSRKDLIFQQHRV